MLVCMYICKVTLIMFIVNYIPRAVQVKKGQSHKQKKGIQEAFQVLRNRFFLSKVASHLVAVVA